jgi:hypothetical protein
MSKAPDCYTGETRDHLSKAASNYTVRAQARSGRGGNAGQLGQDCEPCFSGLIISM